MNNYKATLQKLHANLNLLRERESKYAGNSPLELLNQITDYQQAIALTQQALTEDLTEAEWREAIQPLNIDHTLIEGGFFQKILRAFSLPTEQQRELRNRQIMLQRVYDFWVKGVLENSLHNEVLIELGMETKPEAVEYPWDMVIQRPDQSNRTLPPDIKIIDVFDESGGSLLILGEPDSGKTTMLLDLARQLVKRAEQDPKLPIPAVFNFSTWGSKKLAIREWLVEELRTKYSIPKRTAKLWVENDQLTLLLDDLNETSHNQRQALSEFAQNSAMVIVVVCSRTTEHENLIHELKLESTVLLQPLSGQLLATYLSGAGQDFAAIQEILQYDAILHDLIHTRCMLDIVMLAYQGVPAEELSGFNTVEARRKHIFDMYTQRMFERRGIDKIYPQKKTCLSLSFLAQKMLSLEQNYFFVERIQPNWLCPPARLLTFYRLTVALIVGLVTGVVTNLLGLNGWVAGLFVGTSFALSDWLAARLRESNTESLKKVGLNSLTCGTIVGVSMIFFFLLTMIIAGTFQVYPIGILTAGIILGVGVGLIAAVASIPETIRYVDRLSWSWTSSRNWMIGGLIFGSLVSMVGLGNQLGLQVAENVALSGPSFWIAVCFVFGVIASLYGGIVSEKVEMKLVPNKGPWKWIKNAFIAGFGFWLASILIFGVFGGAMGAFNNMFASQFYLRMIMGRMGDVLAGFYLGAVSGGVFLGPVLAAIGGLRYGGWTFLQHYTLRFILWCTNRLPWKLVPFLDYCVDRIFLRKVGGGYIFIHRYLMEYFASLTDEDIERLTQDEAKANHPT